MNKRTVALTNEQYKKIIETIRNGFICPDGHVVKPNKRIATALLLEANLGLRISDILQLRLSAIIRDGNRYRLNIVEKKTQKKREFAVPIEIYSYIQNYVLENVSTHSFRKFFATSIYVNNGYNLELVRVLLQHSSAVTTQRYIGIGSQEIENALQNHVKLF